MKWIYQLKLEYVSEETRKTTLRKISSYKWIKWENRVKMIENHCKKDEVSRSVAINVLEEMGQIEALKRISESSNDPKFKEKITLAIDKYIDKQISYYIGKMFGYDQYGIKPFDAAVALYKLGTPKAYRELILMMDDPHGGYPAQQAVIKYGSTLKPFIIKEIEKNTGNHRFVPRAVEVFKAIGNNTDIKMLVKWYNEIENSRESVVSVLGHLLSKEIEKVDNEDLQLISKMESKRQYFIELNGSPVIDVSKIQEIAYNELINKQKNI